MQANLIAPHQIMSYLGMGLSVTLHWCDDDWQIFEDVLYPSGEATSLLYTYLEHNSYDFIQIHPNGPSLYQVYKPTIKIKCKQLTKVMDSVFRPWVNASTKDRESMVLIALEILSLRLEADHNRRLLEEHSRDTKSAK
jgi:hypothetical protein